MVLNRMITRFLPLSSVLLVAIISVLLFAWAFSAPALAETPDMNLTVSSESEVLKDNTLVVKANSVSVPYSNREARAVAGSMAFSVSDPQGAVTYKKVSGNSAISIASNGKVKVAKKVPKGTYRIKVVVMSAGNEEYAPAEKTVMLTVGVTAPKTVFIGDSRTYFMHCDVYGERTEADVEKGVAVSTPGGKQVWVALGGAYYNGNPNGSKTGKGNGGFKATLIKYADKQITPGDNVVIAMGANDREANAAKYVNLIKKYRKTKANWKATTIVFTSVTPYGRSLGNLNRMARSFNSDIETRATAAGFTFIDVYAAMKNVRADVRYRNRDATHYLPKYSKRVYGLILKNLPI